MSQNIYLEENKKLPIGGWLRVVEFFFFCDLIFLLSVFINDILHFIKIAKLESGNEHFYLLFNWVKSTVLILIFIEMLIVGFFTGFALILIIKFFKKDSNTPRLAFYYFISMAIIIIINGIIAKILISGIPKELQTSLGNVSINNILYRVLFNLCWAFYFVKSERVKKTFGFEIKSLDKSYNNPSFLNKTPKQERHELTKTENTVSETYSRDGSMFCNQNSYNNYSKFIKKLENDLVNSYASVKGNGVEFINVILSCVNSFLLLSMVIQSFKDGQYLLMVAAIIFLIAHFILNLVGFLIAIISAVIMVIFALKAQYYLVIMLLCGFVVFMYINTYLRKKSILSLIRQQKPVINYFEGFGGVVILSFQYIFFALALLLKGWVSLIMWVIFGILFLFYLTLCYNRLYPYYHRIHYPLMFRYAKIAAHYSNQEEFNFSKAAKSLLETVFGADEAEKLFQQAENKMKTFSDYQQFLDVASDKFSEKYALEFINELRNYTTGQKGEKYIINYCIGEVIEIIFGAQERINYLVDVFLGKVA